jgi:hypothetical protein
MLRTHTKIIRVATFNFTISGQHEAMDGTILLLGLLNQAGDYIEGSA